MVFQIFKKSKQFLVMARQNKKLRHNILIVCEGENTEPQYFASLVLLAKKAWSETHELVIAIKPKPKLEQEFTNNQQFSKHKTPRKKRQLKPIKKNLLQEKYKPAEKYKAVPIRYVKEAQEGLEDGTYESAWAVFDKDYHPKHKEAFELAEQEIDGNKVKIAFSSISFEQWILLHFEKNLTAFEKSECKENKVPINCGTGKHENDCYGKRCIGGYLRRQKHLTNYSKSVNRTSFDNLHNLHSIAIKNAAWLKYQVSKNNLTTPVYELNPYTNMDNFLKYLLNIEQEIVWMGLEEVRIFGGLKIMFSLASTDTIQLILTNETGRTYLFLPESIYMTDGENRHLLDCRRILIPSFETQIINLDVSKYQDLQLNFKPTINQDVKIILFDNKSTSHLES